MGLIQLFWLIQQLQAVAARHLSCFTIVNVQWRRYGTAAEMQHLASEIIYLDIIAVKASAEELVSMF